MKGKTLEKDQGRIILTLTYVVKVTVLSNIQKILAVARCLLKSY